MKLRILAGAGLLLALIGGIAFKIYSNGFLPETVLQISGLPVGVEVVETSNNTSIGTQTFVDMWLLKAPSNSINLILSGRQYTECQESVVPGSKKTILIKTSYFRYDECFTHSNKYIGVTIYINKHDQTLLVEYMTE